MFFRRHKNKKNMLTEKEIKWNLLWKKYVEESLDKKYFILCDYHSGINGGGHYCFFDNKSDELSDYIKVLKILLPDEFFKVLFKAYEAYKNNQDVENMCVWYRWWLFLSKWTGNNWYFARIRKWIR